MNSTVTRRMWASASAAGVVVLSTVAPAFANGDTEGRDPGPGFSVGQTVLWFVVGPLLVSAFSASFVLIPDWIRRSKKSTVNGYLDDPTLADRALTSGDAAKELGH